MKKLVIVLSMCLAFLATTSYSQVNTLKSSNNNEAVKNSHAPYMQFDKLVHDYGQVMENGDGTCEFTVTNSGKEPLILTDAKSSCGCTVPEWPKSPILPGKSAQIKVTYKTSRIGLINKSVTITSNASNSPVVLRIKGEVIKKDNNSSIQNNVGGSTTSVVK